MCFSVVEILMLMFVQFYYGKLEFVWVINNWYWMLGILYYSMFIFSSGVYEFGLYMCGIVLLVFFIFFMLYFFFII